MDSRIISVRSTAMTDTSDQRAKSAASVKSGRELVTLCN
jgi:hypothetical protein